MEVTQDFDKQLDDALETQGLDPEIHATAKEVWSKLWSKWPVKPIMIFRFGTYQAVRWEASTNHKTLSLEIQKEGFFINMHLYGWVKTVSMRNRTSFTVKQLVERMEYLLKVFAVEDTNVEYG